MVQLNMLQFWTWLLDGKGNSQEQQLRQRAGHLRTFSFWIILSVHWGRRCLAILLNRWEYRKGCIFCYVVQCVKISTKLFSEDRQLILRKMRESSLLGWVLCIAIQWCSMSCQCLGQVLHPPLSPRQLGWRRMFYLMEFVYSILGGGAADNNH